MQALGIAGGAEGLPQEAAAGLGWPWVETQEPDGADAGVFAKLLDQGLIDAVLAPEAGVADVAGQNPDAAAGAEDTGGEETEPADPAVLLMPVPAARQETRLPGFVNPGEAAQPVELAPVSDDLNGLDFQAAGPAVEAFQGEGAVIESAGFLKNPGGVQPGAKPEKMKMTEAGVLEIPAPEVEHLEVTASEPEISAAPRREFNIGRFAESFPAGWESLLEDGPAPSLGESGRAIELEGADGPGVAPAQEAQAGDGGAVARTAGLKPLWAAEPQVRPVSGSAVQGLNPNEGSEELFSAAQWERSAAGTSAVARETVAAGARAGNASPAQVLSRLTALQRQMSVEHLGAATLSAVGGGEKSLTIDLFPPDLGRVRVVVENQGSQVNAVLTVQDSAVGSFFQDQTDTLRRQLEQAGVRVGELSVEIRKEFGGENGKQEEAGFGGSLGPWHAEGRAATGVKVPAPAWKSAEMSRVDMTV